MSILLTMFFLALDIELVVSSGKFVVTQMSWDSPSSVNKLRCSCLNSSLS